MHEYIDIFFTFSKIGAVNFGGGYAMLPLLEEELVNRKHWCTKEELLDYFSARMRIYLPTYKYILENQAHNLVMKIAERAKDHDIIFLDYNTNTEVRDISSPISHAGLVKLYIEGNYPDESQHLCPMTNEEIAQRKRVLKEEKKQRKVKIKDDNSIQELTLF